MEMQAPANGPATATVVEARLDVGLRAISQTPFECQSVPHLSLDFVITS